MAEVASSQQLPNRWDDAHAATLSEADLLLYRSNLLGAERAVTNYGGGNTSAKIPAADPLTGKIIDVLWVKGSGGDLGSMGLDGFSTLYLDKLRQLAELYRGRQYEDDMVAYLPHCAFNLNPRAASIDTPLHAFIPHRHVDHMHPDAVIAIAATARAEELTRECFGPEIGFLPWQRPGFDLGLKLGQIAAQHPEWVGVVLGGHGLFTWGETSRDCYQTTLRIIRRAVDWLESHTRRPVFGGARVEALPAERRAEVASALMTALRGKIGHGERKIGHFSDAPEILEFVGSAALADLAAMGTSCPDHFLRTKIRPLVLPFQPQGDSIEALIGRLDPLLDAYRADYSAYYACCRHPDSPAMRDPNPVIFLVPGIGLMSFAKDKPTARIASEFYVNAINVMRGASAIDRYVGLAEQEAFDIEYWLLEEAKLQRLPKPKPLSGQVALVTGGAGGIGRAVAERLLAEGACVVLADIDAERLAVAEQQLAARYGGDMVRTVRADVTEEPTVVAAVAAACRDYGGLDILVSNAGIASAAPVEQTTLEIWQRNMAILSTGYFLFSREAFRVLTAQGLGGSIVFVASKNGLVASTGASAYCTAKAAEIHLARCLALEGAPHGIRVNVVNPDAVLKGSQIWSGQWRAERAEAYKIADADLEEHYRQRSLLRQSVYPEDVAAAVLFFASPLSAKSTGNIINVDAGNAAAFTR